MHYGKTDNMKIINTTMDDYNMIIWLFEEAMQLQGKNDFKVWNIIDEAALKNDIANRLQYKILNDSEIICVFSIQYSDPFIWRDKDKNDAIYLHRIVVHPKFKGQRQFEKILNWANNFRCKTI